MSTSTLVGASLLELVEKYTELSVYIHGLRESDTPQRDLPTKL